MSHNTDFATLYQWRAAKLRLGSAATRPTNPTATRRLLILQIPYFPSFYFIQKAHYCPPVSHFGATLLFSLPIHPNKTRTKVELQIAKATPVKLKFYRGKL